MKKYVVVLNFLLMCIAPLVAHAQIIVSDAILEFKNDQRLIESIAVGNSDKTHSFNITAEVYEIENPGAMTENVSKTDTLFVVPSEFSLSPRSQRTVRFAIKERPEAEKTYKVIFRPTLINAESDNNSKIKVITSTSVMTIVNPPEAKDNLSWTREETRIIFTNKGNTNLVLRQTKNCTQTIECQIPGQRLWAGDKWILNLPKELQDQDITLEYRTLGNIREVTVPYEE